MRTHAALLAAIASAPLALAHTTFANILVNGESQGDGVAIRMNNDPGKATFPIKSLDSDDMACNVGGTKGVSRVLPVPDGATVSFEFRDKPDVADTRAIDPGHKGPCAVYLKKVSSAVDDKATGDGWFKIFDHGHDQSSDRWCTDEINDNNGLLSVKLPKGLQSGYYLARPEILALHAASGDQNDPQFYTGCAQIFLEGSGDLGPEETVSIPGYVKYGQDSTNFNIYWPLPLKEYPLPGPKVAKLTSRGAQGASTAAQNKQTEGLKPEGCILENGNFCATEVSDFSDEKGCWAAGEECWAQSKKCWDAAGATGGKGCKTWDAKCESLNDQCKAKDFSGLKNKGKDLTAEHEKIDVGKLMPTQGAGAAADESTPKTDAPAAPKPTSGSQDSEYEQPKQEEQPAEQEQEEPSGEQQEQQPDYNEYEDGKANASPAAPANDDAAPTTTIQVPVSEDAPAPTTPPKVECPKGFKCVYETVIVTKVEYVTAYPDKRRRSLNYRRHHGRAL